MTPIPVMPKRSEVRGHHAPPKQRRFPDYESKPSALIRQIKTGYPIAVFDHLKDNLGVNLQKLAMITSISLPTLHRRKKSTGRLSPVESERVFRLQRLFFIALDVFEDRAFVKSWFNAPQKAFEGKTPLEYADTQPGSEEVEKVLKRMEHGVTL